MSTDRELEVFDRVGFAGRKYRLGRPEDIEVEGSLNSEVLRATAAVLKTRKSYTSRSTFDREILKIHGHPSAPGV